MGHLLLLLDPFGLWPLPWRHDWLGARLQLGENGMGEHGAPTLRMSERDRLPPRLQLPTAALARSVQRVDVHT